MQLDLRKWTIALLACSLLSGCAGIVTKQTLASLTPTAEGKAPKPRKIVILFDGTHNDIATDTNIKRLHSLIALQDRREIATLYVEGVGVGNDILGMGMGTGFGDRVRLGYRFLLENYRPDDEIYLFGFSRGAYQARALASLLYYTGLPRMTPADDAGEIAQNNFARLKASPDKAALRRATFAAAHPPQDPRIKVLGLWDGVEALGVPDWYHRILHKTRIQPFKVVIDEPNRHYGDQLCNVEHAFQALSLDDNREWIFTPLPLSRKHLTADCANAGTAPAAVVHEVWFSGAHSDVGGGYADSELSGVSLNWMIEELEIAKTGLLKPGTRVRQDIYGSSHDPESGWWGPLYHSVTRNLGGYALAGEQTPPGRLCVHPSVFARRSAMPPKAHENQLLNLREAGTVCLEEDPDTPADPPRLRQKEGDKQTNCPLPLIIETAPACTRGSR